MQDLRPSESMNHLILACGHTRRPGQKAMYDKRRGNQLVCPACGKDGIHDPGIIVAQENSTCKKCGDIILAEKHRIFCTDRDGWDTHLECAPADELARKCHEPPKKVFYNTARHTDGCAVCTAQITRGIDSIELCWTGWKHAACDAGTCREYIDNVGKLQDNFPGKNMPREAHNFSSFVEFTAYVEEQTALAGSDNQYEAEIQALIEGLKTTAKI
jgi:hypothetical protein